MYITHQALSGQFILVIYELFFLLSLCGAVGLFWVRTIDSSLLATLAIVLAFWRSDGGLGPLTLQRSRLEPTCPGSAHKAYFIGHHCKNLYISIFVDVVFFQIYYFLMTFFPGIWWRDNTLTQKRLSRFTKTFRLNTLWPFTGEPLLLPMRWGGGTRSLPPHLSIYCQSIAPSWSPLLRVVSYQPAVLPGAPGSSQRGPGSDGTDTGVLLHTESRGVAPYIATGRRRVWLKLFGSCICQCTAAYFLFESCRSN